ncbi:MULTISPECIES: polysaccharide pyruvyl transferase family protein [unclassified Methylobacterium]|uniref:polysaccharide pyruvyl transferase family protein n=1 Tax=unclassified Methylobacterium TaxID=2615210 RepID=UPI000A582031|nr:MULTISPECIES: polysaccharide pyruvyl transferase family protein [unclassified Methylobacterium]
MKILIYNDTRPYHCGCEAVMDFIEATLVSQGHELRGGYLNYGNYQSRLIKRRGGVAKRPISDEDLAWCDAVLVNGEGGGAARWNLNALAAAHSAGKKTYLCNSIWPERLHPDWKELLPVLTKVNLRGAISLKHCLSHGAVGAEATLDFSYFNSVGNPALYYNFNGGELFGDFYEFEPEREKLQAAFIGWPTLPMIPRICGWDYFVKSLSTASLYVTGRHHGIYAACKARTPFVTYRRENHKILDLFESSGISIPYPSSETELNEAVAWARANRGVYDQLFDWMESQAPWPGIIEGTR